MDVIRDYVAEKYKKLIRSNYDTIIGGGCLIMKDPRDKKDENPFRYIILYYELKENKGNEVDFFLYIKDKKQRNLAVNYILKYNLSNYFQSVHYNYKDEYKKILDEHKKEIGYIVRSTDKSRFEHYLEKLKERQQQKQNLQNMATFQDVGNPPNNFSNMGNYPNLDNFSNNLNNMGNANISFNPINKENPPNSGIASNSNNSRKKLEKPSTLWPPISSTKINPDLILGPIIAFFSQFNEITSSLTTNKNLDLPTFKNIIISKVGQPNIKKIKNFPQAFEAVLTSLDPNAQTNKDYYNQSQQYDEEKGLKKFMEEHDKGNFIQKFFLIPKEDIISCKKCGMKTYQFRYSKYIYIMNPQTDLIFQKLFTPQIEHQTKGRSCNFCNGQETESIIEKKILAYPEKLIVIIEHSQVNIFNLGLNLIVSNGKNLSYSLNQFIEANTNILYQINQTNTYICHPFGKNVNDNVTNKKPIVLFYNLIKMNVPINMISQNNMQIPANQANPNVIAQNMMNSIPANSQQNGQQNPAPQTQNQQVNAQVQSQQNNAAMMNQQKMTPQMMAQQQNINQSNGGQQNNNQMNFQQNQQIMNNQNFSQPNNFNCQNMSQQTPGTPNNFQNNFNNNSFPNNMSNNNLNNNFNTPMPQFNNMSNNNMNNNMNMNGMNNMNNNPMMNNQNMMMNNNFVNNNFGNNMGNNNFGNNMGNNNFGNNMGNNNFGNNMGNNNMNNFNFNINMNNMNNNNMNIMNNMNMGDFNNGNNMNNNGNNMNNMNNMNNNFNNGINMNNNNGVGFNANFNNANNNNNNQISNQNSQCQSSEDTIFVTFTFQRNKKQIYIDVDRNERFGQAVKILEDKYNWLRAIQGRKYYYNNKEITDQSKTLKQLKIDENSDIYIYS